MTDTVVSRSLIQRSNVNTTTGQVAPIQNDLSSFHGTVTLNGATPVTVANAYITSGSAINFTLKTVGGTVGAQPAIQTITAGTGFTVAGTASDTSVYNYKVFG
jgi:hypothetical protein